VDQDRSTDADRQTLLILDATGDLTARLLFPGPGTLLADENATSLLPSAAAAATGTTSKWRDRVACSFVSADAAGAAVDDVLGRARYGVRCANRMLEPVLNGGHVESVEIVYDESLAPARLKGYARSDRLRLGLGARRLELDLNVNGERDPPLSVRGDASVESWRIVEPVLAAWRTGTVPLDDYPAGSSGPDGWPA
jgi:glucose-6-phosphate 1-dehydrogenase